ncbi:MAG: hypothetical protein IPK28_14095 [Devosia sp.]|nr:hypothetical protein [Devosia sp.]
MNTIKIAGAAVAVLVLATSFAQAGNGGIRINQTNGQVLQLAKLAACEVAGTPSEFPDDIWLVNKGAGKLVAGTQIKWNVNGYSNLKGTHTLVAALNPGQGVKLNGVLGSGVEAGHPCSAKAL